MLRAGLLLVFATWLTLPLPAADPAQRFVYPAQNRLVYPEAENGDRIVDFSYCGFGAGQRIPTANFIVRMPEIQGDCTASLQTLIDAAGQLAKTHQPAVVAVQLPKGTLRLEGSLRIEHSGVVLRGAGPEETTLLATGTERRAVVHIGRTRWSPQTRPANPRQ